MLTLQEFRDQQLQDSDFATAYNDLDLPYQVALEVIRLRQMRGLTQSDLASQIKTKQSSISRLESMNSLPSLSFLSKVADVLNARIEIKLVPND